MKENMFEKMGFMRIKKMYRYNIFSFVINHVVLNMIYIFQRHVIKES